MKLETAAPKLTIAQALAKGSCPICALLKEFLDDLVEEFGPDEASSVCKTHAWSLARAAWANSVVPVFLRMLESRSPSELHNCSVCEQLRKEEHTRIEELAREMKSGRVLDWLEHHGSLCLEHAEKLHSYVPAELKAVIDQIIARNIVELRQELTDYRQQVREGQKAGGGLLGRAAEFLVGQRGL